MVTNYSFLLILISRQMHQITKQIHPLMSKYISQSDQFLRLTIAMEVYLLEILRKVANKLINYNFMLR